jgi:hypothetical protein
MTEERRIFTSFEKKDCPSARSAIIDKAKSLSSVKLLSQPNIQSLKFFSLNH